MNLKSKYKQETSKDPYCKASGLNVKSGSYTDGYVKWLEQLALRNVVKPFFCNNCNSQRYRMLTPITYQCRDCGTLQAK